MRLKEIIPDSAWVIEDLLNRNECEEFISKAIGEGIENSQSKGDVRYRNSTTVSIDDEEMANRLFKRIEPYIPKEVIVDKNCQNDGLRHSKKSLYGKWTPYGLNSRWRVSRYLDGGHFGPHRDGFYQEDENHRSLITINGYLTDRLPGTGGATRFVKDDIEIYEDDKGLITTRESDVLHSIESDKAGKAVIFFHDLMHDGEPLKSGSPPKWIFRTEIMYERDPQTAPKISEKQKLAREYLEQAERLEVEGNIPSAIKFYNLAYKFDPSLENPS